MPKATKKSVHVAQEELNQPQDYSENEFPEEFNTSQVSNSDDEVVLQITTIYKPITGKSTGLYALHRGTQNGFGCK